MQPVLAAEMYMRQDGLGWAAWKRGMGNGKNAICQNAIGHRLELFFLVYGSVQYYLGRIDTPSWTSHLTATN